MRSILRLIPLAGLLACGMVLAPSAPLASAAAIESAAGSGPVPGIPYIDEAETFVESSRWFLRVRGHFPPNPGCWSFQALDSARFSLLLFQPDSCVDSSTTIWAWAFPLGRLLPGHHRVQLELAVKESADIDPVHFQGYFEFDVLPDSTPPPSLPYVEEIRITSPTGADSVCAGDSIRVSLAGYFPNPCFSVQRIDALTILGGPIPGPPIVQVLVDRGSCHDFCPEVLTRWQASILIPSLPAGFFRLPVQLLEVDCARPDTLIARSNDSVPLVVQRCSSPPLACLIGDFVRPPNGGECDAFLSPGDSASLTFAVLSPVDLAGLQGTFTLDPPGLRVVGMEAVGVASGMRLDWVATQTGARFTLFAESGAPIPGCDDLASPRCAPNSVVRIEVAKAGARGGRVTYVSFGNLLGSTIDGVGVRQCEILPWERVDERIAFPGARICTGADCDFNADGRADVRDLVLMVHCVNQTGACPGGGAFDCNGDSSSSLADVICCARHILRGRANCPECPPDTLRPAPRVHATLGEPVHSETGAELPLTLIGTEYVGGALVELSFPADRYEATATLVSGRSSGGWLDLYEVRDGKLVIGLVRLGPVIALDVDQRVELAVRLTLRPGQQPGGEVACTESEFSGGDGTMLDVNLGPLAQPLAGPVRIGLSSARPNPSGGETSFTLTLDRPGAVEVGVFDLVGRRVATVHRGPLAPGEHTMRWDGRGDDGIPAANGIYFYRASAGSSLVSRKLALLRQR